MARFGLARRALLPQIQSDIDVAALLEQQVIKVIGSGGVVGLDPAEPTKKLRPYGCSLL